MVITGAGVGVGRAAAREFARNGANVASCVRHMEYFHDHVRIERMLFDGVLASVGGAIEPDLSHTGFGLELEEADAQRFAVRA